MLKIISPRLGQQEEDQKAITSSLQSEILELKKEIATLKGEKAK